jgi:uncharacterized protein (UPF0333 family)
MRSSPTARKLARRKARGQAMVEYSILNWVLVLALILGVSVRMVPATGGTRQNVIEMFLNAYRAYYDSYYFVLSLPYP